MRGMEPTPQIVETQNETTTTTTTTTMTNSNELNLHRKIVLKKKQPSTTTTTETPINEAKEPNQDSEINTKTNVEASLTTTQSPKVNHISKEENRSDSDHRIKSNHNGDNNHSSKKDDKSKSSDHKKHKARSRSKSRSKERREEKKRHRSHSETKKELENGGTNKSRKDDDKDNKDRSKTENNSKDSSSKKKKSSSDDHDHKKKKKKKSEDKEREKKKKKSTSPDRNRHHRSSSRHSSDRDRKRRRHSRSRSRSRSREKSSTNKLLFTQNLNLSSKFLEIANLSETFLKQTLAQTKQQTSAVSSGSNKAVMNSTNRSVSDFIELCKNLSNKGDNSASCDYAGGLTRNHDILQSANIKPFTPSTTTTIATSTSIAPSGILVKLFPVSSGTKHRVVQSEPEPPIEEAKKPDAITTVAIYEEKIDYEVFPSPSAPVTIAPVIAEDKNLGKFTGKSDARLLKPEELEGEYKAWTRKDLLKNTTPITMGIGKKLLEKMGWKEGEGLGKTHKGVVEPIKPDIRVNRQGLSSQEDKKAAFIPIEGKHPVSYLLELCRAQHWPVPVYECVNVNGPSHMPNFLMRVIVNGVPYQPVASSPNKKQAKVNASLYALAALGYNLQA